MVKYYDQDTVIFHNGEFVKAAESKADLFSQSLHYGNGVFDAMRAYGTALGPNIFKARDHFSRFLDAANTMHLGLDYSVDELVGVSYQLLEENGFSDAYIRPLVYAEANMDLTPTKKHNIFIAAWRWDKFLGKDLLDITISTYTRPSPHSFNVEAKISGHYINSIVSIAEAKERGFDDALLLDVDGFIAEGTGANFFFEKEGKLYTSQKGHIYPGITRNVVFDIAKSLGVEVVEGQYKPEDLKDIDGAFFTGTAAQITGINSIDRHLVLKDWEDTIGFEVFEKYRQYVTQSEYDNYSII
ncbi:branched-chain-amino-acid transaminase [Flammeovirga pacifica]|uniref:Branched-chain-amino-acid aminotransferase n=1 Tax=Flammeovirga pacifica TaxID=915059 RepID=A0A1S1Z4W0_FLAPC|nr:branched-chain-amino-acid transaminase [Flammeovirga pacifica]OHX68115.1 branched-chain-amino-acid transaminase [Flammeovirga pacifica]